MPISDQTITHLAAIMGLLSPLIGLIGVWIGHDLSTRHERKREAGERVALAECFFGEIWGKARLVAILGAAANRLVVSKSHDELGVMQLNLPTLPLPLFAAMAPELGKLDTATRTQVLSFYTTLNSAVSHTKSASAELGSDQFRQRRWSDLCSVWRLAAATTQDALVALANRNIGKTPKHEIEQLKKMLLVLRGVAGGDVSDPDTLADKLPV